MTTFVELFEEMQAVLGEACLPLEPTARRPGGLITSEALYPELAKAVAMAVYQSNDCRRIHDQVGLYQTLDALGRLKRSLSEDGRIDVGGMDFLEQLGLAVTEILGGDYDSTIDSIRNDSLEQAAQQFRPLPTTLS